MLTCKNVGVTLGGQEILRDVSFSLVPGALTALIGKNGSGKSTLAACLGQRIPYSGQILLENTDLRALSPKERAKSIAFLPQMLPSPALTVREIAEMGRSPYLGLNRRLSPEEQEKVESALHRTGMLPLANRLLPTLSGGEKQRAYLAMILSQDAPLLVLDEPTAYMDMAAEAEFLSLLQSLAQEGRTLLVILHNLSLAARCADQIIALSYKTVAFSGSREECLEKAVIERLFGVRRVDADDNGKKSIFFVG